MNRLRLAETLDLAQAASDSLRSSDAPLIAYASKVKFLSLREGQASLAQWSKIWARQPMPIRHLELRGFRSLKGLSLQGLTQLEFVDFTDSREIPTSLWEHCRSLTSIRLCNTGVRDARLFINCKNLGVLDLSGNGKVIEPGALKVLPKLQTVHWDRFPADQEKQ
jgi:hypothetical protein